MLLLNAFSVNQLVDFPAVVRFDPVTEGQARDIAAAGVESAVGHEETAALFSAVLGMEIPFNRATITLSPGDKALLGQYRGERLPKGATALPENSTIEWRLITILNQE